MGSRIADACSVPGAGGRYPKEEWGRTRLEWSFDAPITTCASDVTPCDHPAEVRVLSGDWRSSAGGAMGVRISWLGLLGRSAVAVSVAA